jgi:hypothetical protein
MAGIRVVGGIRLRTLNLGTEECRLAHELAGLRIHKIEELTNYLSL